MNKPYKKHLKRGAFFILINKLNIIWRTVGESPDAIQIFDLAFASRTLDLVTPLRGDKIGGTPTFRMSR
jgi:hypothetical protein